MSKYRNLSLVALLGVTTAALAQAPESTVPTNGAASNPSAASTQSQRDVLDKDVTESPATESASGPGAATTRHQRDVVEGKTDESSSQADTAAESIAPTAFVGKAAQDGMTEVALARVALDKSTDAKVRQFAQTMVKDHSDADSRLKALAKRKDITVPSSLDSKHNAMISAMKAKSGSAFDAAYAETMAEDHTQAIALFERMAKSGDGDFAHFADNTLPTLREHKKMADELEDATRTASADEGVHRE